MEYYYQITPEEEILPEQPQITVQARQLEINKRRESDRKDERM